MLDEEYRPSPDGQIVEQALKRADTIELDKSDRTLAAVLVGLAEAMTDEQLIQTQDALWTKASDLSSLPFNFLRLASWFVSNQKARRWDWVHSMKVAMNDGHMTSVSFDEYGPGGRCWYFDCECTPDWDDDAYRATREEALADQAAHMFEFRLTEAAIDEVDEPEGRD